MRLLKKFKSELKFKIVSATDAVSIVKSNDRVFFQGASMTPNLLINSLCDRYLELNNDEIIEIHPI